MRPRSWSMRARLVQRNARVRQLALFAFQRTCRSCRSPEEGPGWLFSVLPDNRTADRMKWVSRQAGAERSARAESPYSPVRGAACVCRDKPIGALSCASNGAALGPHVGRPGHGRCPRDVCRGLEVQPACQTKSGRGRAQVEWAWLLRAWQPICIASRRPRGPACRSRDGLRHRPGARPGPKHRAQEREHRETMPRGSGRRLRRSAFCAGKQVAARRGLIILRDHGAAVQNSPVGRSQRRTDRSGRWERYRLGRLYAGQHALCLQSRMDGAGLVKKPAT
jgi:hypothetical protein